MNGLYTTGIRRRSRWFLVRGLAESADYLYEEDRIQRFTLPDDGIRVQRPRFGRTGPNSGERLFLVIRILNDKRRHCAESEFSTPRLWRD